MPKVTAWVLACLIARTPAFLFHSLLEAVNTALCVREYTGQAWTCKSVCVKRAGGKGAASSILVVVGVVLRQTSENKLGIFCNGVDWSMVPPLTQFPRSQFATAGTCRSLFCVSRPCLGGWEGCRCYCVSCNTADLSFTSLTRVTRHVYYFGNFGSEDLKLCCYAMQIMRNKFQTRSLKGNGEKNCCCKNILQLPENLLVYNPKQHRH